MRHLRTDGGNHPRSRIGGDRRPLLLVALMALTLSLTAAGAAAGPRSDGSRPASARLRDGVREFPVEALDAVAGGDVLGQAEWHVSRTGALPHGAGKKVHVVAYDLAWCPHCAANSWPLAIALSRFGTFHGLRTIDSGTYYGKVAEAGHSYPHTKGLSFLRADYRSSLISFEAVVGADRRGHPLQKLTGPARKAVKRFDPELGAPAMAIGTTYGILGVGFDPGLLAGKSPAGILAAAVDPKTRIAQAVDGEANVITAALCTATGQQPATVCEEPGVTRAGRRLPGK